MLVLKIICLFVALLMTMSLGMRAKYRKDLNASSMIVWAASTTGFLVLQFWKYL